ncbi:hypothetical protein MKW94_021535, partial [Papaver nudicaule]|nr:hypothetical protein [Papaver nudicaule]
QERREGYSGPRDGGRGGAGRGRGGRGSGFGGRNSYTNENSDDYTQNDFELEKDSRNVYDREQGMPSVPGSHKPVRDGQDQSGNPFHRGDRDNRVSNRWGSVQKRWNGKGNWTSPHAQPE